MAVSLKYGRVTVEKMPGTPFVDDEPVFVFRSSDQELPKLLRWYWTHCERAGSPRNHLIGIRDAEAEVIRW